MDCTLALLFALTSLALAGCGPTAAPNDSGGQDAGAPHDTGAADRDASPDAGIDGGADAAAADAGADAGEDVGLDAASCPRTLLVGGMDLATQGWSIGMIAPATVTYGSDYVQLETSTAAGARSSGQLLVSHDVVLASGVPFRLRAELQVDAVDPHNPLDSGAAILASFHPPFGTSVERQQMIYLDPGAVGWSDGTQSFATAVTDGAYHVYELSVDAAGEASLTIDGTPALARSSFVTGTAIALGDQTNEPDVDGTMRIRSVTLLCP